MKKFIFFFIVIIPLLFSSCATPQRVTRQSFAFDTVINITVDKKDSSLIIEAFSLCTGYEKIFSRTDAESELYKLNEGEITSPSEDIKKVSGLSLRISELTDGAFDITSAPLSDLWNVSERKIPPADAEIEKALSLTGYEKVSLNPFDLGGRALDMGAVAKGYIADRLVEFFKANNTDNVIIDLGGNVAVIGQYTVGIRNPFSPDEVFATLTLKDKSAVTSGAYQRYFEYEGKRYHHIIDSRTGRCADSGIASATVISGSSACADALSTAIFILGENGLSLADEFPGTDVLLIDDKGDVITTEGFTEKYNLVLTEKN